MVGGWPEGGRHAEKLVRDVQRDRFPASMDGAEERSEEPSSRRIVIVIAAAAIVIVAVVASTAAAAAVHSSKLDKTNTSG